MRAFAHAAVTFLAIAAFAGPQPVSAQSGNIYGAISYSSANGAFGFSHNHPSRRAAEQRATRECRARRGRNCQVVLWFYNQCAALATGAGNGWGAAHAPVVRQAASVALRNCSRHDNRCTVRVTVCSVR